MRLSTISIIVAAVVSTAACGPRNKDKLDDNAVAGGRPIRKDQADARCTARATSDEIKRQLFARAAEVRGSNADNYARIASFAVIELDGAAPVAAVGASESVDCRAHVTLRFPPGLKVAGGRTALGGDIGYGVAPGAGGMVTLGQSDSIAIPLATLTQNRAQTVPSSPSLPSPPAPSAVNVPDHANQAAPAIPAVPPRPQPAPAPPVGIDRPSVPPQPSSGNPHWQLSGMQRDGRLQTQMYVDRNSVRPAGESQVRAWIRYVGVGNGRDPVQTFTEEVVDCRDNTHTQLSYYVRNANGQITARRGRQATRSILPDSMLMRQMDFICGAGRMRHE